MTKATKKAPRSVAELSHEVARVLREPRSDKLRFEVLDLCAEIADRCDLVSARDDLMRDTLRYWIGKCQAHVGWQDGYEQP